MTDLEGSRGTDLEGSHGTEPSQRVGEEGSPASTAVVVLLLRSQVAVVPLHMKQREIERVS